MPAPPRGAPGPRRAGGTWAAPPKLSPAQRAEAIERRADGATLAELARGYNVSPSAISRLSRRAKPEP